MNIVQTDKVPLVTYDDAYLRHLARKHAEFQRAIEPFIKMKIDHVYNMSMPSIMVFRDGTVKTEYTFTPEQQEFLDCMDKMIDDAGRNIFGRHWPLPEQPTAPARSARPASS